MKKVLLLIIVLCFGMTSCTKKTSTPETITLETPESQQKKNSMAYVNKLPYVKEIEEQKQSQLETKKYWIARMIETDLGEEMIDLSLSSNGQLLLLIVNNTQKSLLYVMNTSSLDTPTLVYENEKGAFNWAFLNNDNNQIFFSLNDTKGNATLNKIDFNNTIAQIPEKIETIAGDQLCRVVVNNKKISAYSYQSPVTAFTAKNKASTRIELKHNNIIFKSFKNAKSPSWSKDGYSLIFISDTFDHPEIVKWNSKESGIQRITISKGIVSNPHFSPNDEWIVYSAKDANRSNLYIANLASQKKKRISYMPDFDFPKAVWGQDGAIYAVGTKNGICRLFQFKMEERGSFVSVKDEPAPAVQQESLMQTRKE